MEREARRLVALHEGFGYLLTALVANKASREALRELVAQAERWVAHTQAWTQKHFSRHHAANLAVWAGDFNAAEA
jgi:hypothetical protein